jgi:hypothetical protein
MIVGGTRRRGANREAYAASMDDTTVQAHIEDLVAEEHQLLDAAPAGLNPEQHARLEQVRIELDRFWDLLRQRRAREEFGLDPDFVGLRDEQTVEGFEQ